MKPTINRYYPVNIATLNVRGLNDQVKQHQILDYINIQRLDIIGLTELHVTNNNYAKHPRYTKNNSYDFFWAINEDSTDPDPASGCALIVKKDFSKHIQRIQTYKGRIVCADFYFKRFNRIRIITVYVPPTNRIELRKAMALVLTSFLEEGYRKGFKLIVMGDFNENMDLFLDRKLSGRSINSHTHRFLNLMHRFQLRNSLEHHSSSPYAHTWKNSSSQSRIDGIYISDPLLHESIMALTDDSLRPNISDHSCVINKFNRELFFKPDSFFQSKDKPQTRSFQFHKMDLTKWKQYNNTTKLALVEDVN